MTLIVMVKFNGASQGTSHVNKIIVQNKLLFITILEAVEVLCRM